MENPYAAPQSPESPSPFSDAPAAMPQSAGPRPRGMVGHVRVLGILMIVQGVLSLMMGLFFIVMAVVMTTIVSMDPPQRANGDAPDQFIWVIGAVYGGMGLAGFVPGIFHIVGGWKGMRFRSRTTVIVALCLGALSSLTFYCAPTSLALLVYGLIVMLDGSVKEAFAYGEQGYAADQIDVMFNPWAYQYQPPPQPQ